MTNWDDEQRNIDRRVEEFRKVLAARCRQRGQEVPPYLRGSEYTLPHWEDLEQDYENKTRLLSEELERRFGSGERVGPVSEPSPKDELELTDYDRKLLAGMKVGA